MREVKSDPTRIVELARKIMDERKAIFQPIQWVNASAKEFYWLDHRFYRETGEILAGEGFTCLGDRESMAVTQRNPKLRSFVRGFLSADGTTTVTVFHVRPIQSMLVKVFRKPAIDFRAIGFCTELKKGMFITTNNWKGRGLDWTPSFKVLQAFVERTPVLSLLKAHRACVEMQCEQSQDEPTVVRTIEEIDQSGERLRIGAQTELARMGFIDEEKEMKQWREAMSGDLARMLVEEIRKIKAEDAERR